MSLSDCSKCWSTPCVCGHEYVDYTLGSRIKLIESIIDSTPREIEKALVIDYINRKYNYLYNQEVHNG